MNIKILQAFIKEYKGMDIDKNFELLKDFKNKKRTQKKSQKYNQ